MKLNNYCSKVYNLLPVYLQDRLFIYLRDWSSLEFETEIEIKKFLFDKITNLVLVNELEDIQEVIYYLCVD